MNREYAEPAIALLPEWTQWCVERGGISFRAAARSRGAALTAAAARATTGGATGSGATGGGPSPSDPAPIPADVTFRRAE
jgi:hypothetical protein